MLVFYACYGRKVVLAAVVAASQAMITPPMHERHITRGLFGVLHAAAAAHCTAVHNCCTLLRFEAADCCGCCWLAGGNRWWRHVPTRCAQHLLRT